jgi:hypothetical protein
MNVPRFLSFNSEWIRFNGLLDNFLIDGSVTDRKLVNSLLTPLS